MMVRGSGLLLHITSLPSRFGIGDLGPAAYRFADFLAAAGQTYWQILPLNPTVDTNPYHGISAFAKNPLLISPELLADDGLIDAEDLGGSERFPDDYVDFVGAVPFKERLFDLAYERFVQDGDRREFETFCREHAWWLDDFALFSAIRSDLGGLPWSRWPDDLKLRKPEAIRRAAERLGDRMDRARFLQFVFMRQWQRLRKYCRARDIRIIGDIPIYMDYDSADVWLHPGYFELDDDLRPTAVSGAPPDVFSPVGQLWGHPLYRWDVLQRSGFGWWTQRMERTLSCVDYVRIDHFRGLVAYWAVPAGSATAMDGRWVAAPTAGLLGTLARKFPCFPVIAEDLGTITLDVWEVMHEFGIPGMKVLVLAFEDVRSRLGAERQHPPQRGPGLRPLHRHPRHEHRARVARGRGDGRAPREAAPVLRSRDPRGRPARGVHPSRDVDGGQHGHRPRAGRPRPRLRGPHEPAGDPRRQLDVAPFGGHADARDR